MLALCAAAALAPAQPVVSAKSGLVYFSVGRVWVEQSPLRSGQIVRQLKAGELLHTTRGRAEVLLNPGTVLRLGNNSQLRMDDVALVDADVSLLAGSAVVTLTNAPRQDHVKLHLGTGTVRLERDGVYRLDSGPGQARLRVFSGRAEVLRSSSSQPVVVRQGASLEMDDLQVAKFDPKDTDALDRWAQSRPKPPAPRGLRPVPPRMTSRGVPPPPQSGPAQTAAPPTPAQKSADNSTPLTPFPLDPNAADQ